MDVNSLEKEAVACTCFAGHGNERSSFWCAKEYVDDDDDVESIFHEGDDPLEPLAAPLRPVNATESFEEAHTARGAAARVVSSSWVQGPSGVLKLASRLVVESIAAWVEKRLSTRAAHCVQGFASLSQGIFPGRV